MNVHMLSLLFWLCFVTVFKFPQRLMTDVPSVSYFLHLSAAPVLHPCPVIVNPWSCLTRPISGESYSSYFLPCVSLIRLLLSVRNCFSFYKFTPYAWAGLFQDFIHLLRSFNFTMFHFGTKANLFSIVFDDCDPTQHVFLFKWKFRWSFTDVMKTSASSVSSVSKQRACIDSVRDVLRANFKNWFLIEIDWMIGRREKSLIVSTVKFYPRFSGF